MRSPACSALSSTSTRSPWVRPARSLTGLTLDSPSASVTFQTMRLPSALSTTASCGTNRARAGLPVNSIKTRADIPTHVLIPAFVISELKTAFQIGFLIFLPFLIIDLVVASTLMSMGMMMLPPIFISLPFKILLFVLVDGWNLVTRSLVESFS